MTITLAGDPVDIESPLERVWEILTDLEKYPEWNPFTVHVDSTLQVGTPAVLDVRLGRQRIRQDEVVTICDPPFRLAWKSCMPRRFPFLIYANRMQVLTLLDNGRTRYQTYEPFKGLLIPLVMVLYRRDLLGGYNAVSRALKARAEER